MSIDKVVIVDGFSDIPFEAGIPPFMSSEVRYVAGACWDRDQKVRVIYVTIEDLRAGRKASLLDGADLVFAYAGLRDGVPAVRPSQESESPGIADVQDLVDYIAYLDCPRILGGPYVLAKGGKVEERLGFDVVVTGDLSKYAHDLLAEEGRTDSVHPGVERTNNDLETFSILGAGLCIQNPGYPSYLSCSVELYRGCPGSSSGGCSFCHQTRYTTVDYRPVEQVLAEIAKLSELGCENVMFESPCFFSYFSSPSEDGRLGLDHHAIEKLLEGARSVAPDLKGMHIGSINPAAIVGDPEESKKILKAVTRYCSDGNFPNLHVVTFDNEVQLQNNTKAGAEETRRAVEMIAEAGKERGPSGLPLLLPTIELVYGLPGEREETLTLNLQNLRDMTHAGSIRGVTARVLVPLPGTTAAKREDLKEPESLRPHLQELAAKVNRVATGMMVVPGQLLREVFPYRPVNGSALARKVGLNALDVLIHGLSQMNVAQDVRVTAASGERVEAVLQPLAPKTVSREILRLLPEMTEERIDQFMRSRPEEIEGFTRLFDDPLAARKAASFFDFKSQEGAGIQGR